MFKIRIFLTIVVLIASAILLVTRMFHFTEVDKKIYKKLIESSQPDKAIQQADHESKQYRETIQKDMWFSGKVSRLHFMLKSKDSELRFFHHDEHTDIIENMHDVICLIQEELYYALPDGREVVKNEDGTLTLRDGNPDDPESLIDAHTTGLEPMQRVRYLESDNATFYYKNNTLIANHVTFSLFNTPGHRIEDISDTERTILMKGVAKSIEFFLGSDNINFHADHLKAELYPQGELL